MGYPIPGYSRNPFEDSCVAASHEVIDSGLVGSGRGTTRAEDAQGTPTQSHISPSILVYEENPGNRQEPRGTGPLFPNKGNPHPKDPSPHTLNTKTRAVSPSHVRFRGLGPSYSLPLSSELAHIRKSVPESGPGLQVKQLKTFRLNKPVKLFPFRSAAASVSVL